MKLVVERGSCSTCSDWFCSKNFDNEHSGMWHRKGTSNENSTCIAKDSVTWINEDREKCPEAEVTELLGS